MRQTQTPQQIDKCEYTFTATVSVEISLEAIREARFTQAVENVRTLAISGWSAHDG